MSALVADRFGWIRVTPETRPTNFFNVQVWDSEDSMSLPAFWADEDGCFICLVDGLPFADGRITHWMEVRGPEGGAA